MGGGGLAGNGNIAGAGGAAGSGGVPGGTSGSSAGTTSETGGEAGAGGANECGPHIPGGSVVWLGDSWITLPGTQYSLVRDRARMTGALAQTDDYVNLAAAGVPMSYIANQYSMREGGTTKIKVLIMDGGTWDPIAAQLSGTSVQDAANEAITQFQQFLGKVAADGTVEHIIYFLVPPLKSIPAVDSMRAPLQQACDDSTNSGVPCYFIDLKDAWAGHADYTDASGIQASSSGASAIADLIWTTMQDNCIAQ
jgi:hypothetical protein